MSEQSVADNLNEVLSQIHEAEKASGRPENSVRLCAVSKFHPLESLLEAFDAGQVLFGENRVQEACEKFSALKEKLENENRAMPQLHIIGSLQSNKVKKALEYASCIQSVDREALLAEIEKQCAKSGKKIEIYFELHTGEDSKSGYESSDAIMRSAENFSAGLYPHIIPSGLMTMAPFTDDEKIIRKSFVALRECRKRLNAAYPDLPVKELSMGMSGDFKIAIEEGSTMVRVGTAIFGHRDYQGQK
ncbi:MAG: YggS family pyridoxal phosphate-dependent enzyme [Treponema sp.]|nr:YggS family pyridoxal phosphate-dependent enzyme [Treponema sp.]